MTKPISMDQLYIACEGLNFDWLKRDRDEFIRLWEEDYTIEQISGFFRRNEIECFLLYIDLIDRGKVKPRRRGIYH